MALSQSDNISQDQSESSKIVSNLTRCDDEGEDMEELSKIIERLDNMISLGDPDRDITSSLEDSDSIQSNPGELASFGADSGRATKDWSSLFADSGKEMETEENVHNYSTLKVAIPSQVKNEIKANISSTKDNERKKKQNPVKGMLKSLKSASRTSKQDTFKSDDKTKHGDLSSVKIDKLPQYFVVKYLGKRSCTGLCGVVHVRKPVDEMIGCVMKQLNKSSKPLALPLSYLIVSHKGLDMREHPNNQDKSFTQLGPVPIDFISYGVQDIKYWRVFTFILVLEMSSNSRKTECHAVICDSNISARKIALSLAAAFQVNMRKLKDEGKSHHFQVELRPPDELADSYEAVHDEEEC